jgi:hypothetical protein
MHKIFVDGKIVTNANFELCWTSSEPELGRVGQSFVQTLADKGFTALDKALRILSDKARVGYLPLEKYEVDMELARKFPAEICQRWCILPFDRLSKSILVATANPFNRQACRGTGGRGRTAPALVFGAAGRNHKNSPQSLSLN